jgi:hypothetical protein
VKLDNEESVLAQLVGGVCVGALPAHTHPQLLINCVTFKSSRPKIWINRSINNDH